MLSVRSSHLLLLTATLLAYTPAYSQQICSTINPDPDSDSGFTLTSNSAKRWDNGQVLRVRFLGGSTRIQNKVKQYANEWIKYANVTFAFGNHSTSEIRISFDSNLGSSSMVGKDALAVPQDQPTMNFGWFNSSTSDEEFRRTTLHEFGHALGFAHEHQNPIGNIPWNKTKVYEYFETTQDPPWDKQTVDHNIFRTYEKSSTNFSNFDRNSIMIYSIPNSLTVGNFEVPWNTQLSAIDKQFAGVFYPKSYTHVRNAAIPGCNILRLSNVTEEGCQAKCNRESWCKSFDYHKGRSKCDLCDKTSDDVGGLKADYENNPYDHYEKQNSAPLGYIHIKNAAIPGCNILRLSNVTEEGCQARCNRESWCKSFDYHKGRAKCDLCNKTSVDVGGLKTNYEKNPYDHYFRIVR